MKQNSIFLLLAIGLAFTADAQVVVNDNFNRPDGSLVGTVPTPGPGAAWLSHSGTLGDLLISGGQAVVQHGIPSEDANVPFALQGSGLITATFDIVVNDDTVIGGGDYEYFAHFSDGGTVNFYSRVDVVPASSGGDYTLGIATASGTAENTFPIDFNYGDTVSLTLSYDWSTGLSSLGIGATTITSTTIVPGISISAFCLRQSDSSNNETILVDNLLVTQVPEPTSFSVVSLAVAGFALIRRRRA